MTDPVRTIVVVTDPMCSWCWGMTSAVEEAIARLSGEVGFDLMLGGINTHGTLPVGAYGKRYMMKLWREVHATTGQSFGYQLPETYVHNSTLPCRAVEAVRAHTGRPPFGYLHRLQSRFFVDGSNINDLALLAETATEFGWDAEVVTDGVARDDVCAQVSFQFDAASAYGTNALPALLMRDEGGTRLLAGGYLDSDMMCEIVSLTD